MGLFNKNKAKIYAAIAALSLSGGFQGSSSREIPQTDKTTEQTPPPPKNIAIPSVSAPVIDAPFKTDTLDAPTFGIMYCAGTQVIRNFVPNNDHYKMVLEYFVHEQKHKDNFKKGLRSLKLSPLQYAKMCMYDEMSANMCEVLLVRYRYLAAEDKQSFLDQYKNSRHSFYTEAIRQGKIHPERMDAASRNTEWSFIANQTKKMWMNVFSEIYLPSISRMTERYLERMDSKTTPEQHNLNMEKALKIAFSIGGVDFSQYLTDKDIEITDNNLQIMGKIASIDICNGNKKEYYQNVNKQIKNIKEKGYTLNPEIIAHIYLAEGMKTSMKGIDANIIKINPNVVSACYHKIRSQLTASQDMKDLFAETLFRENSGNMPLGVNAPISPKLISEIYEHKDINLSSMIPDFNLQLGIMGFIPHFKVTSFAPQMSFIEDNLLKEDLKLMQKISLEENKKPNTPPQNTPQKAPRRSAEDYMPIPDFSQPLLVAATDAQVGEIFKCIEKFDAIPDVMKKCDLKAQAAYKKKMQKSR